MSASLRGVCIGAGYFSQFQYEAWTRIPQVHIAAVCDLDPRRAGEVAQKFGIPRFYADFREMFDIEKPNFVDIMTPPQAHQEICAEAAGRGIHIICQKPLAPTFDAAREIVAHAAAANLRFMVYENFRFQPWHREIKRQLAAGAIGDKLFTLTFRSRPGDGWSPDAYLQRQPYFRDYPRLLIYETGVHFIDTFRYLAGEIDRVTAWTRKLNPVIRGEDCAFLVFEFASGALGQWDANRYNEGTAANPRLTFGEFLLEGNAGSLRLYPDSTVTLQRLGHAEQKIGYERADRNFAGDCCYFTQRHFVDRMIDGQPFETSGQAYLRTLAVQEAAYKSAETRRAIEVKYDAVD